MNHGDIAIPCRNCKEVYLEDVLYGRKVLSLSLSDLNHNYGVATPNYGVYTIEHRISNQEKRVPIMPRISMAQFARFYEVRPAAQVGIVREIRMQLANPYKDYMGRNFYGFLLQELRRTHWATRDIRDFEDALHSLVSGLTDQRKCQPYLAIGEAYIEYWKKRAGELLPVHPVSVDINGLTIGVRPEVCIRTGQDYEVLKLWLNANRPSRQSRQIIIHLMDMARSSSQEWSDSWNVGIWDVRRQEIPPPIRTARDFELGLAAQVAAFLQIWDSLDQQAQESEI